MFMGLKVSILYIKGVQDISSHLRNKSYMHFLIEKLDYAIFSPTISS